MDNYLIPAQLLLSICFMWGLITIWNKIFGKYSVIVLGYLCHIIFGGGISILTINTFLNNEPGIVLVVQIIFLLIYVGISIAVRRSSIEQYGWQFKNNKEK